MILLQKSFNTKFKELKGNIEASNADLRRKIQATDADLKGKIANIEATDDDLQRKIDTRYTQLERKIDARDAELKSNLSFAIPNYTKIVEGKYITHVCIRHACCRTIKNSSRYPPLTFISTVESP